MCSFVMRNIVITNLKGIFAISFPGLEYRLQGNLNDHSNDSGPTFKVMTVADRLDVVWNNRNLTQVGV